MSGGVRKNSRDIAALALACGETVSEAARKARVAARTVYRWQKEPDFCEKITQARTAMYDAALGRFTEGLVGSALTIRHLSLKAKSEAVRLAAARSIVDSVTKLRDLAEVVAQIRVLQEQVNAISKSRRRSAHS
jgi:hypothetical protein